MAVAANKRSVMTLFSGPTDIYSHQVRIVLAEKGVSFEIEHVEKDNPPQDLIDLNPNQSVPTLVDRELTLWESRIIMEYLDERFPHPPLMPVYPVARGESRLYMHRIEKDWYTLMNVIVNGSASEADSARKQLREELLAIAPVFGQKPYFLSDEFSLVDCYLAPLLWRLPQLGIEFSGAGAKELKGYMTRVFERDSFLASLTEAEREMRLGRDLSQLTPRRPYLLRAFYEWLLDNQLTPHLVVDVMLPGVHVPMEYARDGQIVLNIAPRAVGNLELSNDEVRFNARFGGVPRQVSVPLAAVLAIYARENGAGTMFEPEAAYDEDVVSLNDDDNTAGAESETVMSVIDGDKPDHDDDSSPDDEPPPPRGGRPALRVVK